MITLASITYSGEYALTYLQAKSIIKFGSPDLFSEIIFIDNSIEENKTNLFSPQRSINLLRENGYNANLIKRDDLTKSFQIIKNTPWRDQQLLKLLVSTEVHSENYLLLDAKNLFIRSLSISDFIKNEKLVTFEFSCPPALRKWLEASCEYIGTEIPKNWVCMPTATPYMVRKSIANEIINSPDFVKKFYENTNLTEFFIYYAFLKNKNKIDEIYTYEKQFYATFFTTYPDTPDAIRIVKNSLENPITYCGSFHRNRIINNDLVVIEIMKSLIQDKKIIESTEEINAIISDVKIKANCK